MGICMDTEPKPLYEGNSNDAGGMGYADAKKRRPAPLEPETHRNGSLEKRDKTLMAANSGGGGGNNLEPFQTPRIPVVFVLGGPGSGKITYSDKLTRQKKGFVHVNITDLLTQMLEGTDLTDLNVVPTSKVINLIMAAMNTHSNASGFVISGYPRNMRDMAEYLEKIGRCDGVLWINWSDISLERQIEYGAKLGEIDLDLAKADLKYFRKNTLLVAEYFDYKQMLYVIRGERPPESVYDDFVYAFKQIMDSDVKMTRPRPQSSGSYREYLNNSSSGVGENGLASESSYSSGLLKSFFIDQDMPQAPLNGGSPFVIWIMGGPGSSKADKLDEVVVQHPNWRVLSAGRLLWQHLETRNENHMLRNIMRKGEMVPQGTVLDLLEQAISSAHRNSSDNIEGFLITGFPRDIVQAQAFEEKSGLRPPCVLIDCSELELGRSLGQRRGRLDDNLDACKRRLELYRELTLPMLKTLDEQNRLKIVDGDSDCSQVVKELRRCLHREIGSLRRERAVESIQENGAAEREEEEEDGAGDMDGEEVSDSNEERDEGLNPDLAPTDKDEEKGEHEREESREDKKGEEKDEDDDEEKEVDGDDEDVEGGEEEKEDNVHDDQKEQKEEEEEEEKEEEKEKKKEEGSDDDGGKGDDDNEREEAKDHAGEKQRESSEDETGGQEEDDNSPEESGSKPRKKLVRHYEGLSPEVEADLQKVIDEMHEKGIENVATRN